MSKLEVDAIEPQSGTTLTIGASGDSVNIASGASITDFKSTGIDDNATSTAITIDSSENVGIGTSSPTQALSIASISSTPGDYKGLAFQSGGTEVSYVRSNCTDGNNYFLTFGTFASSLAERMRINSSGNVGIGTTSPTTELRVIGQISTQSNTNQNGFSQNCIGTPANYYFDVRDDNTGIFRIISNKRIQTNGGTSMVGHLNLIGERGQNYKAVAFEHTGGGGEVGNITTGSSSTAYNTSSDYRLKENVVDMTNATDRLKQLQPKRFNFISDANTTVDGFIAHEVQDIVPEAISGEKDAMKTEEYEITPAVLDEDGNVITEAVMGTREVPDYQGIDQAKLVPLLVKTIQELEARITALENA